MIMEPDRIQHLLRELAPQVLGSLVRRFPDFSACEDAIQEALLAAAIPSRDPLCTRWDLNPYGPFRTSGF